MLYGRIGPSFLDVRELTIIKVNNRLNVRIRIVSMLVESMMLEGSLTEVAGWGQPPSLVVCINKNLVKNLVVIGHTLTTVFGWMDKKYENITISPPM